MITFVNDVFVSNEDAVLYSGEISDLAKDKKSEIENVGKIVIVDMAKPATAVATVPATATAIKIGKITSAVSTVIGRDGSVKYTPVIDWSNPIQKSAVKSAEFTDHADDTQEKIEVDFANIQDPVKTKIAAGGHSVVFRIIYKDMNTRFRKWTESYEYVTKVGDTPEKVAEGIAALIKKDYKRARVSVAVAAGKITLEALPYDDDDSVPALSPAATVRFAVSTWISFNDEAGIVGIGYSHKFPLPGVVVKKTPGKIYTASPKYVRDREESAMGYNGIINRGFEDYRQFDLPKMDTKLNGEYDAVTILFENMYRTADDLHRLTKQSIEIYPKKGQGAALKTALTPFLA